MGQRLTTPSNPTTTPRTTTYRLRCGPPEEGPPQALLLRMRAAREDGHPLTVVVDCTNGSPSDQARVLDSVTAVVSPHRVVLEC